jgi:hypothetical protein
MSLKRIVDNIRKRKRGRPKTGDPMVTLSVRVKRRQLEKLDRLGKDRGQIIRRLIDMA